MIHRRKVFADILFANNQLQHLVEKNAGSNFPGVSAFGR
jgi:hypothetical protein